MVNFILFIIDLWVLGGLVLFLHHRSPHIGFAPLLLLIGGLTVLLQSQLGIFIEPAGGFSIFLSSGVLVPVMLMSVLVLYVAEGAVPARMTIYGILGMSVLALVLQSLYRLHLSLPGGGSISGLAVDALMPAINPRVTLASLLTFAADMFVIAVFYQGIKNLSPKTPEWLIVGLALMAGLWTDAILFGLLADLGTEDFLIYLPGDVVGKTISALILWPLLAYYMARVAPKMAHYVGGQNRPIFDLLFGSFQEIKLALVRTEAALKESEKERQKEEAYLRRICENIHEALWLIDVRQNQVFYVNPAYERIWGRRAQEFYGSSDTFVNSIHPEDRERVLAGLPSGGGDAVEYQIVRPDGMTRWIRDRAFPIQDEAGEISQVVGITEDITERREMEKQQVELAIEREKVKLLRDFISETSHDLRSPLTAINLKIYHLTRTDDPEKRRLHLEELGLISARMAKMIDDLLTLTRLENIGEFTPELQNINQILREVSASIRLRAEDKGLKLTLELSENEPIVQADETDLTRALANLIDNAANYTPRGGEVRVHSWTDKKQVVIRVSDTGIGIAPEDQRRVFERFYRASNARSADVDGTGLGLAIVKKIVERHHGRVEVSSELGKGTTFMVYLPYANRAV